MTLSRNIMSSLRVKLGGLILKKTRDLLQAFDKLKLKIDDFNNDNTTDGMERTEIESVIQQVNRLTEKLDKFMKIVGRKFSI